MATESAVIAGYETTFITRSELSDDALKAIQDKLKGVVANYSGDIVLTEDWGKRKLAYPIQKESRGHYSYMVYTGKGEIVHEMERNLRLQENVLRFLTVNLEKEFDAEKFKTSRAAYHEAAKRREAEREARREEREAARRGYEGYGDRDRDRSDRGDRGERGERAERPEIKAASDEAPGSSEE